MEDIFIGLDISGYKIISRKGEGKIGKVYRAFKKSLELTRAVKFIKTSELRPEWDNEIKKVVKLIGVTGVVPYHEHGTIEIGSVPYLWIMWDYIDGENLKELVDAKKITISMLIDIVKRILEVLYACKQVGIEHGDLHSGNILVQSPDLRNITPSLRNVWITDFGYGHASLGSSILDDFRGLDRIIHDCLPSIDYHSLEGEEKVVYSIFKHDFGKFLLENNYTEGSYVRNPSELIKQFDKLRISKSEVTLKNKTSINDYLAAELIGDRYDEWKHLFVPVFIGAEELLGKNICILTGLRGCGKTMIFRRVTALFDLELGKSGVFNEDSFLGFYLNARNIAEAFPWLPKEYKEAAREQIIHYFHLSWILEILEWLRSFARRNKEVKFGWLLTFLAKYYPEIIVTDSEENAVLDHLYFFLSSKLDESRLKGGYSKSDHWELTDYQFLDKLFDQLTNNFQWIQNKVFFLFIDDYSTPMVNSTTQEILNPIIFRRSSRIFFKIATESVESFYNIGLNGKMLEENDDYLMVDFGSLTILKDESELNAILSAILKPRIDRNEFLARNNLTIEDLFGNTDYTNIDLALQIRGIKDKGKPNYYGFDTFCSVWSSSVREMISIFAEMISMIKLPTVQASGLSWLIPTEIQDKVFRNSGGGFLNLLSSATPPSDDCYNCNEYNGSYGDHLVRIGKAFAEIANFELKNKTSKNLDKTPPKQPRRIEIHNVEPFADKRTHELYKGLIRYGLFIRDNRGKSVRGKAVPRLVLRGLLIPYFTLTFSKRDHISFSWEEFCKFLNEPEKYTQEFIKKQQITNSKMNESGSLDAIQERMDI